MKGYERVNTPGCPVCLRPLVAGRCSKHGKQKPRLIAGWTKNWIPRAVASGQSGRAPRLGIRGIKGRE